MADSGFVIFSDIEGYSAGFDIDQVTALTGTLCEAAVQAANELGWDDYAAQCTGDGFIFAPNGANGEQALKFMCRVQEIFNPPAHGEGLTNIRVRFGLDFGAYHSIETFGSKNVAGRAPILASRVGSLGDGGHFLVSDSAFAELPKQVKRQKGAQFKLLGPWSFKHGTQIDIRQYLEPHNATSALPSRIKRRAQTLFLFRPVLLRLGESFLRSLVVGGYVTENYPSITQLAQDIKLRASILLYYPEEGVVRVPAEETKKGRSWYRATMGGLTASQKGRGSSSYAVDPPVGVPGHAYKHGAVQVMLNLKKGKGYARHIINKSGSYARFGYDESMIEEWSRRARNFVSVPVLDLATQSSPIAVLSFDFDGDDLQGVHPHESTIIPYIEANFMRKLGLHDLQLLSLLVDQVRG